MNRDDFDVLKHVFGEENVVLFDEVKMEPKEDLIALRDRCVKLEIHDAAKVVNAGVAEITRLEEELKKTQVELAYEREEKTK